MGKGIFLIGVIWSCLSCHKPVQIEDRPVIALKEVIGQESEVTVKLSEFVDSIGYVDLESDKKSLTASPLWLLTSEYIYCGDLKFKRKTGKFAGRMGYRGRGPGEFLNINRIGVDTINYDFYVDDFYRVWIYTDKNELRKVIPKPFPDLCLTEIIGGRILLFTPPRVRPMGKEHINYLLYDIEKEEVIYMDKDERLSEIRRKNNFIGGEECVFWKKSGKICFYNPASDGIYELDTFGNKRLCYRVDLGSYNFDWEKVNPSNKYDYVLIRDIRETSDYLLFYYDYGQRNISGYQMGGYRKYLAVYDKNTGTIRNNALEKCLENDLSVGKIYLFMENADGSAFFDMLTPALFEKGLSGREKGEWNRYGETERALVYERDMDSINNVVRVFKWR